MATQGSDDRLPSGNAVAEIGAVAAWRASQGVYRIHPALVDELADTPLEHVPTEWLFQLPEWCVWVEIGEGGFFAHLESDANTGRPELRFWVIPPDQTPYPVIVHLDRPTLGEGVEAAMREAEFQARAALADFSAPNSVTDVLKNRASMFTALVVYLIGAVRDGDCRNAKTGPGRPVPSRRTPNHPQAWEIGWKQGTAFAAARQAASRGGEHSGPRPHVRRAHWHHFWEGPKSGLRNLVVRWLPPILVGSGDIIPTIHDQSPN